MAVVLRGQKRAEPALSLAEQSLALFERHRLAREIALTRECVDGSVAHQIIAPA